MSEAVADVETETDLGWALGALLRSYRDMVAPALGDLPHGPRGYEVLREVVRDRRPNQLALANRLGIDRTVMTYLLDDLVEAGLVQREPNPDDRRQRLVVATPRGRKAVEKLCVRITEAEASLLGGLDAEQQQLLRQLLHRAAGAQDHQPHDVCGVVTGDS